MKNVIANVKKFKGWGKVEELLRKADYKDKEMGKDEKDLKKKIINSIRPMLARKNRDKYWRKL